MKLLHYTGKLLTVLALGFVVWSMANMDYRFWHTLPKGSVVAVIAVCSVLYAVFFGFLSFGWYLLLKSLSPQAARIPFPILHWIYTKSNLIKYLPGNVLEFVGRNIFTSRYGVPHKQIAFASLLETMLIIVVSAFLGVITGFDILRSLLDKFELGSLFSGISVVTLVAALSLVFFATRLIAKKVRAIGLEGAQVRPFCHALCKVFLLQSVVFINLSLTFFFIYTYGFGMSLGLGDFLFILSGFTLSWTIGFITPGAPGGLGVKELGLVSLLAARFGYDATVLASVLHRIISVAGDLLAYGMALAYLNYERVNGRASLDETALPSVAA